MSHKPSFPITHWFYEDAHGVKVGPLTDEAFRNLRECGTVRDTTLVWRTGWSDWSTIWDIWLHGNPSEQPGNIEPPLSVNRSSATAAPMGASSDQRVKSATATTVPASLQLQGQVEEQEFLEIKYTECSVCHQPWAEHLLFGGPRLHVCAPCLKAHEEKRKERHRFRTQSSGTNSKVMARFSKVLLGLGIAGGIIFLFHFFQGAIIFYFHLLQRAFR
jgi:hypothetical protein